MAVGLCWLPLRHPYARPSSSTLPGHDTPNPSTHGQQLDPGCIDHPVAPPLSPEHDGSNWGQDTSQPRALWAASDRCRSSITPTAPNTVTTPPAARGLGAHPWSYNPQAPSFFLESSEQDVCPSPGSPTHRPTCHRGYHHRYTPSTETDLCGSRRYSVDPGFVSLLLKTGHPTLHTLSPPSPPGAASRDSVSRNAAKLLWTHVLTQMPMRGQLSNHSPT